VTTLPTVTALIAAHDAEAFIGEALDSALAQDYPAGLLDVLVVDDGSTDATAAIVADRGERHPGRVRLLRRERGGNGAAVTTGLPAVRGELTAFLDADDAWPPDKLRRQVAALPASAGLLYGDMRLVDADGATLEPSWLEMIAAGDPPSGRCFGRLLAVATTTSSSTVMRTALARSFGPIPGGVPPDWWLSLRAALCGEIAYLAEPRTLYRFHGANQSLGSEGPVLREAFLRRARTQRWFLRRLEPGQATAGELADAWASFERNCAEALRLSDSAFVSILEVGEDEREDAWLLAREGRALLDGGEPARALVAFLRAAASDPWQRDARAGLEQVLAA
jgi:glycosyltransferase involved in cell wall biosynthesis